MMQQEQLLFKARELFDNLITHLLQSVTHRASLHETETFIWNALLSLGKLLLQFYIESQGTGDVGPTLEHEGRTLRRLDRPYPRRHVSVFGEIEIPRTVYGTRENQKHEVIPLDAWLNLPDSDFSYLLQDWAQAFCIQGSYQEAVQTLERILGRSPSVRSLEHMSRQMAQEVKSYRDTQPSPPPKEEGAFVVITVDGKGVPMRRESSSEEKPSPGRRRKGDKANPKKQACVGAVYTINPFPRTAEDVVEEVFRQEVRTQRPHPCHKEVRAELTRETNGLERKGKDRIFDWLTRECQSRNVEGKKAVVCVMDGDRALWTKLREQEASIIGILDLYHVMERLWSAAYCFHEEGSEPAKSFVKERLRGILQGQVGRVIGGLRQMARKQGVRGSKRKQLQTVITYLENHREWMAYDYYLELGYPIGSGVVEGACRHLVKDRLEQTGMRWKTEGAQSILDLRATYINEDWKDFQEYRTNKNLHELYPYRDQVNELWPQAA